MLKIMLTYGIIAGGIVIAYTVFGGTKIVSLTQRYQIMVILAGMATAFGIAAGTRRRRLLPYAIKPAQLLGSARDAVA